MVEIKEKLNENNFKVFDVVELLTVVYEGQSGIVFDIDGNRLKVFAIANVTCNIVDMHFSHFRKSDKEITFKN